MLTFGDCSVNLAARVVLRDGSPQHLEPQAFDVLAVLIEHRDRVVPKEEILDTVWGGRFITDSALSTRIKEIRRATGDDGDAQSVIRTVRGRGYQFVADVAPVAQPIPTASLLGRERDVEELLARMEPGALVTLVGPGGAGKSTLAREVVRRAAELRGIPAYVVDLTVIDDGAQLLPAVARGTAVVDDAPELLAPAIARRDAIVLLDDADLLVPDVAALCDAIVVDSATITIVVTCRERLGSRGERVWPVLPLGQAAARSLLLARARDSAPLADLGSMPVEVLDGLVDSVDRLPLAIEMLASMSALLEVDELQAVVATRSESVTTGRRDSPERHRSLARLVEGSLDRLDPTTSGALVALAAFAGAFTTADAVRLLGGEDALVVIRSLADRSLLSPVVEGGRLRYQVLRTVRRAVAARTPQAERLEAARRHAELVTTVLEAADADLRCEREAQGSEVMDRLADEARAAHFWAREHDVALAVRLTCALHLYSYSRMWAEPAAWATALERLTDDAKVVVVVANQLAQDARLNEALARAHDGYQRGDDRTRMAALEVLSDVGIYAGDYQEAVARARELIEMARASSDTRQEAIGLTDVIVASVYADDPVTATAGLADAAGMDVAVMAPSDRAWLAFARAEACVFVGIGEDPADLTSDYEEAISLATGVGNRFVENLARSSLADAVWRVQGPEAAAVIFLHGIEEFVRHGNVTHLSGVLRGVVPVLFGLGADEEACTVSGWALLREPRPGVESDIRRIRECVNDVRSRVGAEDVDGWLALGATLDVPAAAQVAIRALAGSQA